MSTYATVAYNEYDDSPIRVAKDLASPSWKVRFGERVWILYEFPADFARACKVVNDTFGH